VEFLKINMNWINLKSKTSVRFGSEGFQKSRFSLGHLMVFGIIFASFGGFIILSSFADSPPVPMHLISRNLPAFTNDTCSGGNPASNANDANFNTSWYGNCNSSTATYGTPVWLAYDLSSVSSDQRANTLLAWYSNCCSYDNNISNTGQYNLPGSYTIEANTAAGGAGSAPSSGWVNLVTVTNNNYHSRQHVLNLTGYNWVRINVTASDGSSGNFGASISSMDIYDTSSGVTDDWIFYGDSISEGAMGQSNMGGSVQSFSQMVNSQAASYYPVEENGGIGSQTTASALGYIDAQLALFPGHYVGLQFGGNDAGCGNASCVTAFYNNYVQLVQKVLALGKVPMVPLIPWQCNPGIAPNVPTYNQKIQDLWAAFPQIIHGPDFYTYFQNNQSLISGDCVHPSTPAGMGAYRQLMANTMVSAVYNSVPDTTPPVISNVASGSIGSSSATITWTTDELSDSQVEYGTTASYGSSTTLNSSMVTSHSVNITGLSSSTLYHFRVKSKDSVSNLATGTDNTFTTGVVDTTHPTVNISAPTNGVTVSGTTVTLSATAADNIALAGVQFKLDGSNLGSEDTTSPYSITWDTTSASNGSHSLTAVARDTSTNSTTSAVVSVTVDNSTLNLLSGKIAATNGNNNATALGWITNGDKTLTNIADMGAGAIYLQYDLGSSVNLGDIKLWHYYGDPRSYHDVLVELSNSSTFATGNTIVFNNDTNNSLGLGAGTDSEYAESSAGKDISFSPVSARYIRIYSNGSSSNTANHYVEAEAYAATSSGPKQGDINNDNSINITDLSLLLSSYGQTTTQCITNTAYKCDLSTTPDNLVNIFDLSILLSNYGM
jgi:lysophospholipase L1-like esterase